MLHHIIIVSLFEYVFYYLISPKLSGDIGTNLHLSLYTSEAFETRDAQSRSLLNIAFWISCFYSLVYVRFVLSIVLCLLVRKCLLLWYCSF